MIHKYLQARITVKSRGFLCYEQEIRERFGYGGQTEAGEGHSGRSGDTC